MKTLKTLFIAMVLMASLTFGQTALSTTTLGAAITDTGATTITLASTSTMQNAGPQNQPNTVLYVDAELMNVVTVVDSTHVVVQRAKGTGLGGVATTHANSAPVLFSVTSGVNAAPLYFSSRQPTAELYGSCTATRELVLPKVYVMSGDIFQCLGSQWVLVNKAGKPVKGTTVASPAGLMTITGTVFTVSGTNAITGINVPVGWAPGMSIYVIPSGIFTWTNATNISLGGTAVVGKTIIFTWDGSKWNPSVVA